MNEDNKHFATLRPGTGEVEGAISTDLAPMNRNNLYIDEIFHDNYKLFVEKNYHSEKKPAIHIVENGIVIPFTPQNEKSSKGTGGVINSSGEYITSSQTSQENLMLPNTQYDKARLKTSRQEVIYLGYFIKQWGHFLIDFMTRGWWIVDNYKEQKIVYVTKNTKSIVDGNYVKMLELLGIPPENIIPVFEPTKFKKIIIPEMAMLRPLYYTDDYLKIFQKIVQNVDCSKYKYKKVYFTRRKYLKAKNSEIGEKGIEKFFKFNGYTILQPEKCCIEKQIAIFHTCPNIATLSGTIPHNIVFGTSSTNLMIINKTTRINLTQILLNQAVGCFVDCIDAFIALLPVSPASGPFWIEPNGHLAAYAKERNMKLPKPTFYERIFSDLQKRNRVKKYFLMYCRNMDESSDIGGKIIGSSRPLSAGFEPKPLYYYYRKRLGVFNCDVDFECLLRSIAKTILKKIKN